MSPERHLAGVGVLTILNLVIFGLHLIAIALLVVGGGADWLGLVALGALVVGVGAFVASLRRPRMGGIVVINAVILFVYLVIVWTVVRTVCWGSCGDGSHSPATIEAGRPA